MGSSPDDKRRRARKRRRSQINKKKIVIETLKQLINAIGDLQRTTKSKKRSHSSSSSSTSDSSATSSLNSSSSSSTSDSSATSSLNSSSERSTSGSSMSVASSSKKKNRRHHRVSQRSRSRSTIRRDRKKQNGGSSISRTKLNRKSRSRNARPKYNDNNQEFLAQRPRKKQKINDYSQENAKINLQNLGDDSQLEPGTSSLVANILSDDRKSYNDDSKRRNRSSDKRKKNNTKSDDGERFLPSRQKSEIAKQGFRDQNKCSKKSNFDESASTSVVINVDGENFIDDTNKKQIEASKLDVSISNDDDHSKRLNKSRAKTEKKESKSVDRERFLSSRQKSEIAKQSFRDKNKHFKKSHIDDSASTSVVINVDREIVIDDTHEKQIEAPGPDATICNDDKLNGDHDSKRQIRSRNKIKKNKDEIDPKYDDREILLSNRQKSQVLRQSSQDNDEHSSKNDIDASGSATMNLNFDGQISIDDTQKQDEFAHGNTWYNMVKKDDDALSAVIDATRKQTEFADDKTNIANKNTQKLSKENAINKDDDDLSAVIDDTKKQTEFADDNTNIAIKNTQKLSKENAINKDDDALSAVIDDAKKQTEFADDNTNIVNKKTQKLSKEKDIESCDDEEDPENSENNSSEAIDDEKQKNLQIAGPKNGLTSEDVTKNGSFSQNEGKIVPEELATTSGLQKVNSDHQIIDKNALNFEEIICQQKLLQESGKKKSTVSAIDTILAQALKPLDAAGNLNVDEEKSALNLKSPTESTKLFSSQETEDLAEKEPTNALESAAGVEKSFAPEETKNFAEKEAKSLMESAKEFADSESVNHTEKESLTSQFQGKLVEKFGLHETGNLTEKNQLITSTFPSESAEELVLKQTENDVRKEKLLAEKLLVESAEKLGLCTENIDDNEPLLLPELTMELVEEIAEEKSPKEFFTLEIEDFTDIQFIESKDCNSVTEVTENNFLYRSEDKIEENVPAANFTVDMVTTDIQVDAKVTQKMENRNAEKKMVENVSAANSVVEIVTTNLQEDAEDSQKMENEEAEKKIEENVPAMNFAVEMVTIYPQKDAEDEQELENRKAEEKIVENVPAGNSVVEIVNTNLQEDAKDAQKVENRNTEEKVVENGLAANFVVEIVTTELEKDVEANQEVENENAEDKIVKNVPAANSVVEIVTTNLQTDAEDTQKMKNEEAEEKIRENVPAANFAVEIVTINPQKDAEDEHELENRNTETKIEENVPAANSVVEVVTTNLQADAEDAQKVENRNTEEKIGENGVAANFVVEIVTTELKKDGEDNQEVENRNTEETVVENGLAANFVVEIVTTELEKDVEDNQEVENEKAEDKIVENVPAANSVVEIVTTNLQEDAEDSQKMENEEAEKKIEETVPAANCAVEIVTIDPQKDAEDEQELETRKAEEKIVENVPAANSVVEIVTTNLQEDAEDAQKVQNRNTEKKIEENVPAATFTVDMVTTDIQKDAEDPQKMENRKAEQKIIKNVPAANYVVEIFTANHQEDAEDEPEVDNEKAEQKIIENVPVANSVVEIVTTDYHVYPKDKHEVANKDAEQKLLRKTENPMLSAIDEILTPALKKFGTSRRKDLTEVLAEFNSQDLDEKEPPMIFESPLESEKDFISSVCKDFVEESLLMPSELLDELPPQEIEFLTDKSSTTTLEILSKSSDEFCPQEMKVFTEKDRTTIPDLSAKSVEKFVLQDTEKFAVKPQMAHEFSPESREKILSQGTQIVNEKELFVTSNLPAESPTEFSMEEIERSDEKMFLLAPSLSTESQEPFFSQETEILNQKESFVTSNLPAESPKEFSLEETERSAEKMSFIAPKLSTKLQEPFFSEKTQVVDEKESLGTHNLPAESPKEFSPEETERCAEKMLLMAPKLSSRSQEPFFSQETQILDEKESVVTHNLPAESPKEFSPEETERSAEKMSLMAPKLSSKSQEPVFSDETQILDEKESVVTHNLPAESPKEFSPEETERSAEKMLLLTPRFSIESQEPFFSQETQILDEKESVVTHNLPAESPKEFSPEETERSAEKMLLLTPRFSTESQEQFCSQKTLNFDKKEPSVTSNLPAESPNEFSLQEIERSADEASIIAAKLPKESEEKSSLHTNDFTNKEQFKQKTEDFGEKKLLMALESLAELSEEVYSQETNSPAEKNPNSSAESSTEFFSQKTGSPAEKEPSVTPKLFGETSEEFFSQEPKSCAEQVPQMAPEFSKESSQEFISPQTKNSAEKELQIAFKFTAEPSHEFSSQETGSCDEKESSLAPELLDEFSDEFLSQVFSKEFRYSQKPKSFAEKEPAIGLTFPVQSTQKNYSEQVENFDEKEKTISLKFSQTESSQQFSSQDTGDFCEFTPMEIDTSDIPEFESTSSDSSLEIISKLEAEQEDYESLIYSLNRKNSNYQDENKKEPQTPKNIIPLIKNIIKINPKEINEISKAEKSADISNRSKEKIVDKYRALPSSQKVVCKTGKRLKRSSSSPIDMQILPNYANNSAESSKIGSTIDSSLANDWTTIMRHGLSEKTKEQLIAKHPPAKNCPALKTPILNANFRYYMDPNILRKDRQLVSSQNQLSAAISAVGKVFSIIQKENVKPEAIEILGEAGKILADLHHENFFARKSQITPEIGNVIANVAGKNFVDCFLFEDNDSENFAENRTSTSRREIEMQKSEKRSQNVLRFNKKSAKSKSDDENKREFIASFSKNSDVASLISNDDSAEKKSDTDLFECFLSSDNEDFDFDKKSNEKKICEQKNDSQDSSETTSGKKTQPEVIGIRETLFSSNDIEKSVKAFNVVGNDEKIVCADPKITEIQFLPANHDLEVQKSDATHLRSVTIDNEQIDFEAAEHSPEVIFVAKFQPEVTETLKTSISSKIYEKSVENYDADNNDLKIVFVAPETTEKPSSIASKDSLAMKSQSAISGMIKASISSNEDRKSSEMLTGRETSEKSVFEPEIVIVKNVRRIWNETRDTITKNTAESKKSFESNVANIFGSNLPICLQGNRLNKKSERSDTPRSSKILIKSDTLVKLPQKLSIVREISPKLVSFASSTISPQEKKPEATSWKIKSMKLETAIIEPSNTIPSKVEKQIPEAWGTVKVQAKGAGYAILQMTVQYNVDIKKYQTPPPVQAFDLVVRPHFYGRNQSHITYFSCQRWINVNESSRSGMAVLDVTIPTGYIIQQQNLDRYIRSRQVRNLQRARFQDRKVLFYFDYLDQEETCVNFTVERWFPVANMSRYLPVRVYDYYSPERFNETIFDSLATYVLNICEVCGSSQCPYCHIYNAASLIVPPTSFVLLLSVFTATARYFRTQHLNDD